MSKMSPQPDNYRVMVTVDKSKFVLRPGITMPQAAALLSGAFEIDNYGQPESIQISMLPEESSALDKVRAIEAGDMPVRIVENGVAVTTTQRDVWAAGRAALLAAESQAIIQRADEERLRTEAQAMREAETEDAAEVAAPVQIGDQDVDNGGF